MLYYQAALDKSQRYKQAKMELDSMQRRHEEFLKENQSYINKSVEYKDASTLYREVEKYRKRLSDPTEEVDNSQYDDFDYIDEEDVGFVSRSNDDEETDCNNNVDENNQANLQSGQKGKHFDGSVESKKRRFSAEVGCVMNILEELDACLENLDGDNKHCGSTDLDVTLCSDSIREHATREQSNCGICRPDFSKVVDSVLVAKRRLSESNGKGEPDFPTHSSSEGKSRGSSERVSKSLLYEGCDPGQGFVKFSQVSDRKGESKLVTTPFDSCTTCPPHFVGSHSSRVSDSYFASLNQSGNLSPFIRSIAGRYDLFDQKKPHFKKYDLDIVEPLQSDDETEESYGSFLFRHLPSALEADPKSLIASKADIDQREDQVSPGISRMISSYVYDVLTGGTGIGDTDTNVGLTASDIEIRSAADIDSSVAVCFDENSVTMSKEKLEDDFIGIHDCSGENAPAPSGGSSTNIWSDEPVRRSSDGCVKSIPGFRWSYVKERTVSNLPVSAKCAYSQVMSGTRKKEDLFVSADVNADDDISALINMFEEYTGPSTIDSPTDVQESMKVRLDDEPDVYPLEDNIHQPYDFKHGLTERNSKHSDWMHGYFERSWKLHQRYPSRGRLRQHSSFCRISFTDDDPPFWFSKDFDVSPSGTRVRSPKRTNSDLKTGHGKEDFKKCDAAKVVAEINAEHWSPAKKRRRSDCNLEWYRSQYHGVVNTNSNAGVHSTVCADSTTKQEIDTTCSDSCLSKLGKMPSKEGGHVLSFTDTCVSQSSSYIMDRSEFRWSPHRRFLSGLTHSKSQSLNTKSEKMRKGLLGKTMNKDLHNAVTLLNYRKLEDDVHSKTVCLSERNPPSAFRIRKQAKLHRAQVKPGRCDHKPFITKTTEKPQSTPETHELNYVRYRDDFQLHPETIYYCLKPVESPRGKSQWSSVRYDDQLRLDPESLNRCLRISSPASQWQTGFQPCSVMQQDKSTVESFFEHDQHVSESVPSGCLSSSPGLQTEQTIKQDGTGTYDENFADRHQPEELNAAYVSLDNIHLNYCDGAMVTSSQSSKDDLGDVTPDTETLMKDLQGLDLSETPLYADTVAIDGEMKHTLSEALDSLDNIMSESFSFSESPVKVEKEQNDTLVTMEETCINNTSEAVDDPLLTVVGRRCVLHKDDRVDPAKIIKTDMLDDTVEVLDDSVLNIEGQKCIIHAEKEEAPDTHTPIVNISSFASSFADFDESFEVEDTPDKSFVSDHQAPFESQGEHSRGEHAAYNTFEKQPSYFCVSPYNFDGCQASGDTKEMENYQKQEYTADIIDYSHDSYSRSSTFMREPGSIISGDIPGLGYSRTINSNADEIRWNGITQHNNAWKVPRIGEYLNQYDEGHGDDTSWTEDDSDECEAAIDDPLSVTREPGLEQDEK